MSGLVGDTKRQANDSLRGYIYQILRSVIVWLDLNDTEELYLEGAEDLDRIGDGEALTEQVKDTAGSGNVTLRTASVIDAINHFWEHTERNSNVTLRFRYLTTSNVGIERGVPFGAGQGGLDLWNSASTAPESNGSEEAAASLKAFLLAEETVGQPIREFLSTATHRQILTRLIMPIEWVTGQKDGTELVRQIKDRLVIHGAASRIAPADAEIAFDALYTAAFDAAAQKDEIPLNRASFLRIFAGATAIQLPKQDLVALMQAAIAPRQADTLALQTSDTIFEGPPSLPARHFRRVAQEQLLGVALNSGSVLLHGSTGTGKTLIAASHFVGEDPLWLPLRDLGPIDVRSRLTLAVQAIRAEGRARILVVDDLDALADPRTIEASLTNLWHCQRDLGGQLLLTSDRALPARLAQAVELLDAREIQMQPLDRSEIEAFLQLSNCPNEDVAMWGGILELSTLGHPQLVNARVAALVEAGFPEVRAEDLLGNTPATDRIRFEARRLIAELPVGPRELLYRASLVTGRMTRQHLSAIARIGKAIDEPGDAIDVIAGPWLEATMDGAFRFSPLARGAAEEARGLSWVKSMHGEVAWTYLLKRTMTPWDVSSVLMHCFISGSSGPLMHLMQSLFSADEAVWVAIAEACEWCGPLGLGPDEVMPFDRVSDLFIFRIFQYRIAAEKNADIAVRIAAKLDEEFAKALDDEATHFFRFLFLSQFLSQIKVRYPMSVVVTRAEEFLRIAAKMEASISESVARAGKKLDVEIPHDGYAQFVGLRFISHVQNIDDIHALMKSLGQIPQESARAMLESIGGPEDMWSILIERAWLAEHNAEQSNWSGYCDIMRKAFDFCTRVGAPSMARGIAPVLIRTINENLGDAKLALEVSDDLAKSIGDEPIFGCARAKVMSDAGNVHGALAIWKDALTRWPNPDGDIGAVFAFRAAAIASAKNDLWNEASSFFDETCRLVDNEERPTFALGLAMDAAFCRFNLGDRAAAVTEFGAVVAALEPMQEHHTIEPLLSLQRRAGGILSALADGGRTETELKTLIGLCSNLDPFETDAKVAPPLDMLRINLIQIELAHGASLFCSLREAPILRMSPFNCYRSTSAEPLFALAQRMRDFTSIVSDGLRQLDAFAMTSEQLANNAHDVMGHYDDRPRPWTEGAEELLISKMIIALFDLAAADELDRLPLALWRATAETHANAGRLIDLIDHIAGLFVTGDIDGWATTINPTIPDWSTHAASALAATLLTRLAPDALLACHALWAHYFVESHMRLPVAASVASMVTYSWCRLTTTPALHTSPRTSISRLLSAIEDPSIGWSKTRLVLQAALEASPLSEGDQSRATIEHMSD